MDQKFIDKIKSRGYWRINLRPVISSNQFRLAECQEVIEKNSVELRGWDYPHVPRRSGDDTGLLRCSDYVEAWIDWSYFKEFWRMYRSSQFLHYMGLRADWMEEEEQVLGTPQRVPVPNTELSVIDATYQLTEIFEFTSRMMQSGLYSDGVEINISLHNLQGRKLVINDPRRVPFMFDRKTGASEYKYSKVFSKNELLSDPKKPAREVILEIFELFGWDDPPINVIEEDQDSLLNRRPY